MPRDKRAEAVAKVAQDLGFTVIDSGLGTASNSSAGVAPTWDAPNFKITRCDPNDPLAGMMADLEGATDIKFTSFEDYSAPARGSSRGSEAPPRRDRAAAVPAAAPARPPAPAPSPRVAKEFSPWKPNTMPQEMGDAATPLPRLQALVQESLAKGMEQFKADNQAQAWVHYGNAVGTVHTAQRALQGQARGLPGDLALMYMKACSNFALCSLNMELPYEAIQVCQVILTDDSFMDQLLLNVGLFVKLGYRYALAMRACGDTEGAIDVLQGYVDLKVANPAVTMALRDLKRERNGQGGAPAAQGGRKTAPPAGT